MLMKGALSFNVVAQRSSLAKSIHPKPQCLFWKRTFVNIFNPDEISDFCQVANNIWRGN